MSKSKAKKQREKWQREGKRNPEWNRKSWNGFNPVERKPLKPIVEMRRQKEKYKPNHLQHSEDHSVYFFNPKIKLTFFNSLRNYDFFHKKTFVQFEKTVRNGRRPNTEQKVLLTLIRAI